MGVMERMRNSTTAILWLLIVSFGLLWVLADTQMFDAISAGPRQLGEVNGEPITFDAYNSRVSYYLDQHSQQFGGDITAEIRSIYEQRAWDDLVQANLLQQKINELGITVTDEELVEMITGPNPDPFIRQQFADDQGNIDRVALQAAIEAPENSEIWVVIESQLRENRRQQKVTNYLTSSNRVSRQEVVAEYMRQNTVADIRYLRVPYSSIPDSAVAVTDSEIRSFYRANLGLYEREASFDFSFVSFPVTPTSDDSARAFDEVRLLAGAFAEAEDDSAFLADVQSAIPFNSAFVPAEDVREEYNAVTTLAVGETSDVISIGGQPHVFKKTAEQGGEIQFGILTFPVVADPLTTVDVVSEQAEDFLFYAAENGFEEEAERLGRQVQTSFTTKGAQFAAGIGQSVQIPTVLESLKEGELSEVIELDWQFVVIRMDRINEAGARPLDEVRTQIQNRLLLRKKGELAAERLAEVLRDGAPGATLEELAALSDDVDAGGASNIRMDATVVTGLGREPQVVGAVSELAQGERSGVIEGASAAYVVEVDSKTGIDSALLSESQLQPVRLRLQQERGALLSQVLIEELRNEAEIKDFRSLLLQ
jgi:peptidyl-prolyl cis-trans isomerase D